MTGGIPAAIFLIVERLRQKPLSIRIFIALLFVGFFAASFQTWRDEYKLSHGAAYLHRQHVAQLKKFFAELGPMMEPLPKKMPEKDFAEYIAKVNAWYASTSTWIGKNMGVEARAKFTDLSDIPAVRYSIAINDTHNLMLRNLSRLKKNLDELIVDPAWDKDN